MAALSNWKISTEEKNSSLSLCCGTEESLTTLHFQCMFYETGSWRIICPILRLRLCSRQLSTCRHLLEHLPQVMCIKPLAGTCHLGAGDSSCTYSTSRFRNMEIQGSAVQNFEDICSRNYGMNQAELCLGWVGRDELSSYSWNSGLNLDKHLIQFLLRVYMFSKRFSSKLNIINTLSRIINQPWTSCLP